MPNVVAIIVAIGGGFFSLALMFVEGINAYGNWDEHAFLGAFLFFVSIGFAVVIRQLGLISEALQSKRSSTTDAGS